MHDLEPYLAWERYYRAQDDPQSPFYGIEANYQQYEHDIYGYYIHPDWDAIGSETLYLKLLYVSYADKYCVLEMFGEWNDTLHNDAMHLKRNVIDVLIGAGVTKYILIGEHILNFHGGEDDYYQEWFEEVEDGWIALINFREHVESEMSRYRLDYYLNYGGQLSELDAWRTLNPLQLYDLVRSLIVRRIGA